MCIDSCTNLARCFLYGNSCDKDEKKAFGLFKLNWEENERITSCNYLAYC